MPPNSSYVLDDECMAGGKSNRKRPTSGHLAPPVPLVSSLPSWKGQGDDINFVPARGNQMSDSKNTNKTKTNNNDEKKVKKRRGKKRTKGGVINRSPVQWRVKRAKV